jgi:hypothetical protein
MAKRRMPAALRAYWAKHRKNPRARRHHHRYRANPHHVRRHRYRHNPLSSSEFKSMGKAVVVDGGIGALGALANNLAYGFTAPYLPTAITGQPAFVAAAQLVYAMIIGTLGNMVMKGKGEALAVGAATVAIYQFASTQIQAAVPSLPLSSGLSGMGAYMSIAPSVGARTLNGFGRVGRVGNVSQGQSVVRQLTRTTQGMGNVGAYLSRTGVRTPQRGMGAYMSGMGDTTFANGIPTG